jgi:hypothetical protein
MQSLTENNLEHENTNQEWQLPLYFSGIKFSAIRPYKFVASHTPFPSAENVLAITTH